MSTLNVIGEFLENWEQPGLRAAARDLTQALAETAPRGCASALLIASNTNVPEIEHPRASVDIIPLHTTVLPFLWLGASAARPLDGEFVHSISPLVPLRKRTEDDGSQTSVTVLNTLAWDAPDALPKGQAKHIRQLVRRAVKHADVIITPTHAVAGRLYGIYGTDLQVQVVPLAPPSEYTGASDATARREALGLPDEYLLSHAYAGDVGRLEWIFRALEVNPALPPLVLIGPGATADISRWTVLGDRVMQVEVADLADAGAIVSGAAALVAPQQTAECLLAVHGALSAGVPVVHAGSTCIAEIVLDAGVETDSEESFAEALAQITSDESLHERLSVLAQDRARMFSWRATAWQLWEIHANL